MLQLICCTAIRDVCFTNKLALVRLRRAPSGFKAGAAISLAPGSQLLVECAACASCGDAVWCLSATMVAWISLAALAIGFFLGARVVDWFVTTRASQWEQGRVEVEDPSLVRRRQLPSYGR